MGFNELALARARKASPSAVRRRVPLIVLALQGGWGHLPPLLGVQTPFFIDPALLLRRLRVNVKPVGAM